MISNKANKVEGSITMAISALAKQMKTDGEDILSFSAGEPDYDTPDFIKKAAKKALDEGKTTYTPAAGITELKKAIVNKLKQDQNLTYARDQVVVSCGAKHAIYNALITLLNPNDEVIVPTPYWVSYPDQIKLADGIPVFIETDDTTAFKITPQQLKNTITKKTKALILNSPSNPTGSIYSKKELTEIGNIATDAGVTIISDEIYEKLVYDGNTHTSIAECGEHIKNNTIIINGVSKAYAMTGWRIGYIAAPKEIATAIGRIQSHTTSNPCSISQWASVTALEKGASTIEMMRASFEKRKQIMVNGLNNISGISCLNPAGAFYVFPNISKLYGKTSQTNLQIKNSLTFCEALLKEAKIACIPGIGFGADNYIRLSYATSEKDIKEGLERIEKWVKTLTK